MDASAPSKHDRIARGGLINEESEDAAGEYAKDEASDGARGEDDERAAQGGAHDLGATGPERGADAEFAETFGYRIGGHAEDAGDGEHRGEHSHDAEGGGGGAGGKEVQCEAVLPSAQIEGQARVGAGDQAAEGSVDFGGRALRSERRR